MTRVLGLAGLLLALGAASASAEQWTKTYDVSREATLDLDTDDGNVHVIGGPETAIRIDVEAEGWKFGPGGLKLRESQTGHSVRFQLDEPAFEFHFGLVRRSVRIDVHVPEHTALDVHTGDGTVTCEGLSAPVTISTGDGNVSVHSITGTTELRTGDGGIEATDMDGSLTASTGDGRVRIHGRFDALDVSSHDGGVTVDVAPGSAVHPGWSLRTGDGPVVLRLPTDLRATLDAHTGDGGLTVDLPVNMLGPIRDNALHATLNGGGAELRIRTSDGSIVIEPFDDTADAARVPLPDTSPHHGIRRVHHGH